VRLLGKADATFNRALSVLAFMMGVLLILVMLGICADIFMRYFLNRAVYWMEDVAGYCLLYITFLVAAWLLKQHSHVRMDLVLVRLSERQRAMVNTGTSVLGAIICLFMTWYTAKTTWELFQLDYRYSSMLKPLMYPLLAAIPIGSFLLSIQFLKMVYGYSRGRGTT